MRAILRGEFLNNNGFRLKGLSPCDITLLAMADGHQVRLLGIGHGEELGIPRSLCGAQVVVSGSNRLATIGGVITVDGTYYGLTVAHAFTEDILWTEQQETAGTGLKLYDSDWAYDSSDDCDGDEADENLDRSGNNDDWVRPDRMPDNGKW